MRTWQIFPTYLKSYTLFAYPLYNFYGAKMRFKDCLQGARPMLKRFSGENF